MTGTAQTSAEEFHKVYGLDVTTIPTNKQLIRDDRADKVYQSANGKYQAVLKQIKECHEKGQPILVGTTSIEASEHLSQLLKHVGIPHEVLTRLRPSEIVSVYIMSYTAKYKDRSWYNLLLGLPSNKIIKKLTNEGIQRYNAVRMMKKGEDKAREYAPLDSRLASLSNDGKNKFYEAFRTKQLSVREPYRTGPFTSENSERFYQYGIDTFVPKIIEVFQDIYKLKTIKP